MWPIEKQGKRMTQVFLICTPLTDEIFSLIDVQDVGDSIQSLK